MLVDRANSACGRLLPQLMVVALEAVLNPAASKLRNEDDRLTLGRVGFADVCAASMLCTVRVKQTLDDTEQMQLPSEQDKDKQIKHFVHNTLRRMRAGDALRSGHGGSGTVPRRILATGGLPSTDWAAQRAVPVRQPHRHACALDPILYRTLCNSPVASAKTLQSKLKQRAPMLHVCLADWMFRTLSASVCDQQAGLFCLRVRVDQAVWGVACASPILRPHTETAIMENLTET